MSNLKINNLTKLNEDKCYLNNKDLQNSKFAEYKTKNFKTECDIPNTLKASLQQPNLLYRDGYGWNACNIDIDSKLRNADSLTNKKCINHLLARPHKTSPFFGKGVCDVKIENDIKIGELTNFGRVQNNVKQCVNRFVPQIPSVRKNIQNIKNLIPEVNRDTWIRGGIPSRQTYKKKLSSME